MFRNIFLLLSICILFLGCKNSKKTTENSLDNEKELYEYTKETILEDLYVESSKTLINPSMNQIKFIINEFSQDELSELIEEIYIDFDTFNITETDLMFLEYFPQLKKLLIFGGGKMNVNIEGLKYLHNIEELQLWYLTVFDISPIANLVSLKSLRLLGLLELNDLSPIASLNSLESLYLVYLVNINDISAISNLKNLKRLAIANAPPSDYKWDSLENINPIFDIINLKHLDLYFFKEGIDIDKTNIKKLKNLEYLFIGINSQEELELISDLPQLKRLLIYRGNFNDVSPLLRLNKIEEIDFSLNHTFYDIMPLAASKSLKYISMDFEGRWNEFLDNGLKLFEKNGIEVVDPWIWQ